MAHEKQYTPKQAALAVLDKVGEVLAKSELYKMNKNTESVEDAQVEQKEESKIFEKTEGYKPQNSKKENAKPSEHNSKDAMQHANGPGPKGEIHPKEKEAGAPTNEVRDQKNPQHNPKEEAEGNNELAGTTPTQVGQDGKNKPGYDEMKGHLKLAKFIGRMDYKRSTKQDQSKVAGQEHVGNPQAAATAQHQQTALGKSEKKVSK